MNTAVKSTTIYDLMSTPVETLHPDDDLDLASALMRLDRLRHLPVVEDGKVVGMVSDRDVLRHSLRSRELDIHTKVRGIMSAPVACVAPEMEASEVAQLFRVRRIDGAPVVNNTGDLIGMITTYDLLALV